MVIGRSNISNQRKPVYGILLVALIFISSGSRQHFMVKPIKVSGVTMGTTYHITYFDSRQRDLKNSIDSILVLVNKSINSYDPSSEVCAFNKSKKGIAFRLPYLYAPLKKALEVAAQSNGAFDPTVLPLVNLWGFGPDKLLQPDSAMVDSLLSFVGYNKIKLNSDSVIKTDPRVQLDFGGIGQGYGVDIVAKFLKSRGIENFLVEIGGEGIASGKNISKNGLWKIGILDPNSTLENQFFKAYVSVENQSFTTSGNYFNYRTINGRKYGHMLDPKSGYPVQHELLSVSVFAKDCATADAWDTALMVLGHKKAIELLKEHPELDALLIFSSEEGKLETYITSGLKQSITIE